MDTTSLTNGSIPPEESEDLLEDEFISPRSLFEYTLERNPNSRWRIRHGYGAWAESARRLIATDNRDRSSTNRALYAARQLPYRIMSLIELPIWYFASFKYLKYDKGEKRYQLKM